MANSIVLLEKGKSNEAGIFPLDVDNGGDARSLCHMGDESFWILFTRNPVSVRLYRLDRRNNVAVYTGKVFTLGNSQAGWGITSDGNNLYVGLTLLRGTTYSKVIIKVGRDGSGELARWTYNTSTGFNLSSLVYDLTFDGTKIWYGYITGVVGANHKLHFQNIANRSAEGLVGGDSGSTLHCGVAFDKGGSGLWWSDTNGGKNVKLIDPQGFVVRDSYAINTAGTMRGMEDTGPFLAMIFN